MFGLVWRDLMLKSVIIVGVYLSIFRKVDAVLFGV